MKTTANRFVLRDLTRDDHEQVDTTVGAFDGAASYRRYVDGMARFRSCVEASLTTLDYPGAFGNWRPSMIAADLRQDLVDLGGIPSSDEPGFELPGDVAGLVGVFYVLEGASLGARVLVKRAAALGYDGENGARHLVRQTAASSQWQAFQDILESIDPQEIELAAIAARRTFGAARDAFKRAGQRELAG